MNKQHRSASSSPVPAAAYQQQLVDTLRATHPLAERTLEAFATIPRHPFLTHYYRHQPGTRHWTRMEQEDTEQWYQEIYQDQPLVTQVDASGRSLSSSSQPSMMALMLDALEVQPGMCVLEVGTGTGYQTGLLAALTGDPVCVTTVDIEKSAIERAQCALQTLGREGVTLLAADGRQGYTPNAPYDRIVVSASAPQVASTWARQLAPGGRLVCVLQPLHAPLGGMLVAQEHDGTLSGHLAQTASFMPLRDATCDKHAVQVDWHAPLLASFSSEESPLFEPELPRTNPHFAFFLWMRMPSLAMFQRTKQQDLIYTQDDAQRGYVLFRGGSAKHIELRGERSSAYPLWMNLITAFSLWQTWGQPSITHYHFEMECGTGSQALSLRMPQGIIWPFEGIHYQNERRRERYIANP